MMTISITFRAKREWWPNAGDDGLYGYKIPKLQPHHVDTPICKWDMRTKLTLTGERVEERVYILRREQLDLNNVVYEGTGTDRITIAPRGNGFMADITYTLQIGK